MTALDRVMLSPMQQRVLEAMDLTNAPRGKLGAWHLARLANKTGYTCKTIRNCIAELRGMGILRRGLAKAPATPRNVSEGGRRVLAACTIIGFDGGRLNSEQAGRLAELTGYTPGTIGCHVSALRRDGLIRVDPTVAGRMLCWLDSWGGRPPLIGREALARELACSPSAISMARHDLIAAGLITTRLKRANGITKTLYRLKESTQ